MIMHAAKAESKTRKVEVLPADEIGPFFYDLSTLDEEKKSAAFEYLEKSGAVIDDASGNWKSDKPLKKLISCRVKPA